MSVVVTALLAGVIRMGIEYASTGSLSATGACWAADGYLVVWWVAGS